MRGSCRPRRGQSYVWVLDNFHKVLGFWKTQRGNKNQDRPASVAQGLASPYEPGLWFSSFPVRTHACLQGPSPGETLQEAADP